VRETRGQESSAAGEPAIWSATIDDAELLWVWANDAETRRWSFQSDPIPWETHVAWLETKLADRAARIYVVGAGPTPRAAVRFEPGDAGIAVVSVVVDPDERGRGWGTRALRLACQAAVRDLELERVDAYIKPENTGSVIAFERAGFAHAAEEARPGVLRMSWYPERQ
jgi:UDP-2,4-diacetamido-2,4,6-trideoxy-beta-L-altropyranose hydrolase